MEEVIEKIVDSIGLKWEQLYTRLHLDYRVRFKIMTKNAKITSEPQRLKTCAQDTIKEWLESTSQTLPTERDKIDKLLQALSHVRGMEGLAQELAHKNGVTLEHGYTSTAEESSPSSEGAVSKGITSRSLDVMQQVIDLGNVTHKFAILDLCQSLQAQHLHHLSQELGIPETTLQHILKQESLTEERYYRILKFWITKTVDKRRVTFLFLEKCLRSCREHHILEEIVQKRFHSV